MAVKLADIGGMHTNTLLAQQVDQERAGLVALVSEQGLAILVLLHALDILVEEVCGVHWAALGFRMELSAEDGSRGVDQALVGLVVEVGKVLPPLCGKSCGINRISVVLRRDVAFASCKVQSRDIVGTVAVLQLQGLGSSGESEKLVTHTDTHDRNLGGLHQLLEIVDGGVTVSGITRAVGDEDAIEVVSNLVDGVVERKRRDTGTTGDKASEDVLLNTAVD